MKLPLLSMLLLAALLPRGEAINNSSLPGYVIVTDKSLSVSYGPRSAERSVPESTTALLSLLTMACFTFRRVRK